MRIYDTYVFRDKDPLVDEMRTAWQKSGQPRYEEISAISGVGKLTMRNWFEGKTKSPQTPTSSAFMGFLGYTRKWVRDSDMVEMVEKLKVQPPKRKKKKK